MNANAKVFVVDDDPAVRDSLALLLEQDNIGVESFDSAESFLSGCRPGPHSCAIVDMRMPGMDGLQLQDELSRRGVVLPIIFLTGHGTVPQSVRAIKAGAVNFLTKPVTGTALLESVREALRESDRLCMTANTSQTAAVRVASLTERERDVMRLVIEGRPNKLIADALGISVRTVEVHRARVFDKMGVKSAVELANLLRQA